LSQDAGWQNLNSVTRRRDYDFVRRDRVCLSGQILAVDASSVLVNVSTGNARYRATVRSSDLIRITDGESVVRAAIFNRRSSWMDIGQVGRVGPRERILVTTLDGQSHVGTSVTVDGDSLKLSEERPHSYRKGKIRRVQYVRTKSITATQEYFAHENVSFLDPQLWWGGWLLGTISVPLYDSSLPEDNSEVTCVAGQRRHQPTANGQ